MSFTNYGLKIYGSTLQPRLCRFDQLHQYPDQSSWTILYDFLKMLSFNLFWTFSNVIIHVALGILIAVILDRQGLWFKGFYRALYILPIVVPQIIVASIFRNMFDPDYGAINQG